VKSTSLFIFLLFASSILSSGQRIGPCPPNPPRIPQNIKALTGVVVDENSAPVPKVKVKLQVPDGKELRDIAATETDLNGRFSFEAQPSGNYRLIFASVPSFASATIPVRYLKAGFKGIRLTLPIAPSDSCPQDWESRLKVEEMTGREGRE
jgi:5-hydroxyisourate hydrolase-like protein (transthyretin family)